MKRKSGNSYSGVTEDRTQQKQLFETILKEVKRTRTQSKPKKLDIQTNIKI